MSGGPRGPVPKRPEARRRRNKPTGGVEPQVVKLPPVALQGEVLPAGKTPIPTANSKWHPLAKEMFESLATSGQAVFYEPSDWAYAKIQCELLSRQLRSERMNANMIAAVMNGLGGLLVTEGDRRRARLILERDPLPEEQKPEVVIMADYKKQLGAQKDAG